MIVQVWRRAQEAAVGRVVVAAAEQVIADAIVAEGGEAVLTDPDHPSGSARIYEALCRLDPGGAHAAVADDGGRAVSGLHVRGDGGAGAAGGGDQGARSVTQRAAHKRQPSQREGGGAAF